MYNAAFGLSLRGMSVMQRPGRMRNVQIRFDHGPGGMPCRFTAPQRVITAWEAAEVPRALAALDAARSEGWLAGYASYELGYALEPRLAPLMPQGRSLPLLHFGVYEAPMPDGAETGPARLYDPKPAWDADAYAARFSRVHDYICAGDIYQANLTFRVDMQAEGDAASLYRLLRELQPVRFGALIEAEDHAILSRSPELFFRTGCAGRIETRPMKGTQPRSADPSEDARNRFFLQSDAKNRAENLMIVDLLRNDLSRICQPGSVLVPDLFAIESFETVHQMTSRITGQMQTGTGLADILRALFPCGSITGAPKLRAMEVLAELEDAPRDIYCGSIGWAAPGGRAEFNVAIRTLLMQAGRARLNIGGGVVYDSTAAGEYEEALWKARFATLLER